VTERRTDERPTAVTIAGAPGMSADPQLPHGAVPAPMADEQDILDRLATWLADVSAEAALAGNGTH